MIFALEKYDDFFENQVVKVYSLMNDVPIRRYETSERVKKFELENPDEEFIVIGSIGWVESYLGFSPKPDYYPAFLSEWFGRSIWEADKWPLKQRVFIKPSDKYKRFNGMVTTGTYKGKKRGPYICSDVVKFVDEWRYYVANGKVHFAGWYSGENDGAPAPELNIEWPVDYVGAVDFGRTIDGRILLVEAQHPYGIGWYGRSSDSKEFVEWSIAGWRYMKRLMA